MATDVRLTQDAEQRTVGEKNLVSFSYADNPGNEKDETMFVRVTVAGKLAELFSVLKKGDRVNVRGKMTYNTYKKNDGSTGIGFKIDYPESVTRVFTDQPQGAVTAVQTTVTEISEPAVKRGRPPGKVQTQKQMPWESEG